LKFLEEKKEQENPNLKNFKKFANKFQFFIHYNEDLDKSMTTNKVITPIFSKIQSLYMPTVLSTKNKKKK